MIKLKLTVVLLVFILGCVLHTLASGATIVVKTPLEGDKIRAGADFTVTWAPEIIKVPYVKITLLNEEEENVAQISSGAANRGDFTWSVPLNTKSGNYRIKIYTNDLQDEGLSGLFTIEPPLNESLEKADKKPSDSFSGEKASQELDPILTPKPGINTPPAAVHKGKVVTPVVTFDDPYLEQAVREIIKKPAPATIFSSFLKKITILNLRGLDIKRISGLEYFYALKELDLGENSITDISRLSFLDSLRVIRLDKNQIKNIEPLLENRNLGSGVEIDLSGNPVNCQEQKDIIDKLRKRGVVLTLECK